MIHRVADEIISVAKWEVEIEVPTVVMLHQHPLVARVAKRLLHTVGVHSEIAGCTDLTL